MDWIRTVLHCFSLPVEMPSARVEVWRTQGYTRYSYLSATKEQAESLSIPLVTLTRHTKLVVAIDGADVVDWSGWGAVLLF
jgi:hypothetical protein